MKKPIPTEETEPKRRRQKRMYYVLAAFENGEMNQMGHGEIIRFIVERINATAHLNLEVVETVNPARIEIREKHR